MSTEKKMDLRWVVLVAVVLAGAAVVVAVSKLGPDAPEPEDMTFNWSVPTTGSVPVRYDVEVSVGVAPNETVTTYQVTTNSVTFPVEWVKPYKVRVRGIDAQGRPGVWSIWSSPPVGRELPDPTVPGT